MVSLAINPLVLQTPKTRGVFSTQILTKIPTWDFQDLRILKNKEESSKREGSLGLDTTDARWVRLQQQCHDASTGGARGSRGTLCTRIQSHMPLRSPSSGLRSWSSRRRRSCRCPGRSARWIGMKARIRVRNPREKRNENTSWASIPGTRRAPSAVESAGIRRNLWQQAERFVVTIRCHPSYSNT